MKHDAHKTFLSPSAGTSDGHSQKIPVEHLDYDYIRDSKDAEYLEKILRVLRYR